MSAAHAPGGPDGSQGLWVDCVTGGVLFGCKGPHAADWLAAQGATIPAGPNTWSAAADGAVVARLGTSEFFVGAGVAGGTAQRLSAAHAAVTPAGVYPVLREDWAFTLGGCDAAALLAQVCNVDFAALDLARHPVIMTLMAGVAVLAVPQATANGRLYQIWCDPTYGPWLGATLQGVVRECGGTYRGASE